MSAFSCKSIVNFMKKKPAYRKLNDFYFTNIRLSLGFLHLVRDKKLGCRVFLKHPENADLIFTFVASQFNLSNIKSENNILKQRKFYHGNLEKH
jgi:hypothetical protein